MDPKRNPFAPGAGNQPPELAGRQDILQDARVALARIKAGRPARGQLLLGLRGVGKTVLLNRIDAIADEEGFERIYLEAREDRSVSEMLAQPLRTLLVRLSRMEHSRELAKKALGALRSFASAFKIMIGDVEFGVNPAIGRADSGDLETDLSEVFLDMANAARAADRPIGILIDELQYLSERDLGALITAMHRLSQKGLPCLLFGAGLPQLAALAGEAKSYAERLFRYPTVGPLAEPAAREAIRTPVLREHVEITDDALSLIVTKTQGYPYFLQEWGAQAWNMAPASPINRQDVEEATKKALQELDESFFRVRMDRLTPRERDYVRAMAELGTGPHRSGDIASKMRLKVTKAGPLRNGLIKKGMIYGPQHGETAFTVPMFDEYLRRSIPEWKPPGTTSPSE